MLLHRCLLNPSLTRNLQVCNCLSILGPDCIGIDHYHRGQKISTSLPKALDKSKISSRAMKLIIETVSEYWRYIALNVPKDNRVSEWQNLPIEIEKRLGFSLTHHVKQSFTAWVNKWVKYAEKISITEKCSTGPLESFHGHNLRFWSKRTMNKYFHEYKQQASIMSWNREEHWLNQVYDIYYGILCE